MCWVFFCYVWRGWGWRKIILIFLEMDVFLEGGDFILSDRFELLLHTLLLLLLSLF